MSKSISESGKPDLKAKKSVGWKMAATAGALTVVPPAATDADVVFVDDRPVSHTLGFEDFRTVWDIDGNGITDFSFRNVYPLTPITSTGGALYFPMAAVFQSGYYSSSEGRGVVGTMTDNIFALNRGVAVGPTLAGYAWATGYGFSALRGSAFGFYSGSAFVFTNYTNTSILEQFAGFQEGNNFFGFRFEQAGELHYGWAELNIDGRSLTLSRWAYESFAGVPIEVGAGAPIPEPSSLTLLALGAAGVLGWRQRRIPATAE